MAVVVLSSLLRWAIWPSQHMGICSGVTTASGFGLSLLLMITNASPCTSDSGDTLLTAPSLTFWNRFHTFRQRTDPFKSVYKGRESRNNNEKKKLFTPYLTVSHSIKHLCLYSLFRLHLGMLKGDFSVAVVCGRVGWTADWEFKGSWTEWKLVSFPSARNRFCFT